MKITNTLFLIICFSVSNAQTKSIKKSLPLSQAQPETVGMSSERLARIDSMCVKAIADGSIPGAVALVTRDGKIIYHKAFGMADNQTGRVLKKDDIFRIASQTKAITATAIMMLWEEGRFRLDDPISKYIPEFKDARILKSFKYEDTSFTTEPAKSEITIRQLLTHTSGIGYGIIDADERFKMIYQKAGVTDLFTTENISIGESIKKLARLPLHHNPGEHFTYSEGLDILGYLVEKLSGQPFDEFLRKRLFNPLGMNDTWFYLPKEKESRLVTVQKKEAGKWIPYPVTFYDPAFPVKGARRFFSAGAGLSSTAYDYATFLQMYLNGGEMNGVRILSRTTVDIIMSNQIGDSWDGNFYGLAFQVVNQKKHEKGGESSTGTFGWGGYFNSQYFADPKEKTIGIIMKQTQGTDDDTPWKFLILVGQALDD
jgi:CubicO group peptidase (beta-lactamase class C family)